MAEKVRIGAGGCSTLSQVFLGMFRDRNNQEQFSLQSLQEEPTMKTFLTQFDF